ncbi:hypothetical protein SAMN04487897_12097 [Paenibacillus sp. yr247]|uniref:hypothetical protein n=1 Tax=Paenibacillus sp. yr247 TaxID=1761880 RepID=UPI0008802443|nr:hypothetical protein [Paenibacillus sp. yr247]SDO73206.1 hypothetical protein SAMN04487897_12097 [Paenibacillus sp. yr247]
MIRKLSRVFTLLLLVGCIGFAAPAWGAEKPFSTPGGISYEMKEITVQYAAEFTAYPLSTAKTSVSKSVYEAVYNSEAKPLQVLYGAVKLTSLTGYTFTEEFIRVSDSTHFARGLSNGGSWIYNANNQVRGQDTEFVTGKKLEGSSVVKDYSDGWKMIRFSRSWDDYGNPMKLGISFKWDLKGTADPFFQKLTETEYQIDLSSLRHTGGIQAVQR